MTDHELRRIGKRAAAAVQAAIAPLLKTLRVDGVISVEAEAEIQRRAQGAVDFQWPGRFEGGALMTAETDLRFAMTAEQIIANARMAKCFMYEARDTDDPLPRDSITVRAAVALNMLVRQGAIVGALDDLAFAHAIATIAINFADDPPNTSHRAALFAADLGGEP